MNGTTGFGFGRQTRALGCLTSPFYPLELPLHRQLVGVTSRPDFSLLLPVIGEQGMPGVFEVQQTLAHPSTPGGGFPEGRCEAVEKGRPPTLSQAVHPGWWCLVACDCGLCDGDRATNRDVIDS